MSSPAVSQAAALTPRAKGDKTIKMVMSGSYYGTAKYSPSVVSIKKGKTLILKNMDSMKHSFTSDTGAWKSVTLLANQTKTIKVTWKKGTYGFHCKFHEMTGTLTVK